MSKEYIEEVLLTCASHIDYVNRTNEIPSPSYDLLLSVAQTLTLLASVVSNKKDE